MTTLHSFVVDVDVVRLSLNCGHQRAFCSSPSGYMSPMESHGGMILTGETRRTMMKSCPSATFSTNPTWTDLGADPGLRDERWRLTAWAMAGLCLSGGQKQLSGSTRLAWAHFFVADMEMGVGRTMVLSLSFCCGRKASSPSTNFSICYGVLQSEWNKYELWWSTVCCSTKCKFDFMKDTEKGCQLIWNFISITEVAISI
jgi:hypothetical protein